MPALTLANLVLYAAQAALLIGALALMLAALRPSPAFRLAACRAVLLVLLLLPFQGLLRTRRAPHPANGAAARRRGAVPSRRSTRARSSGTVGRDGGGVLVAGIACGCCGSPSACVRLAGSRRARLPGADDGAEVARCRPSSARAPVSTSSPGVHQPVTFGVAPALVLLPAALLEASPEHRRAVLCHELLHVRRRDWPWVLVEEAVARPALVPPGRLVAGR